MALGGVAKHTDDPLVPRLIRRVERLAVGLDPSRVRVHSSNHAIFELELPSGLQHVPALSLKIFAVIGVDDRDEVLDARLLVCRETAQREKAPVRDQPLGSGELLPRADGAGLQGELQPFFARSQRLVPFVAAR